MYREEVYTYKIIKIPFFVMYRKEKTSLSFITSVIYILIKLIFI